MDFYERHSKTLREIRIESIDLEYGSWATIFGRIRDTLSLEKATICGDLNVEDPYESLYLGPPPECMLPGETRGIGADIEKYLLRETDLLDIGI